MPKVSPWHAKDSDVYHNNTKCHLGNNIEKGNIRPGTGGKTLCHECQKLNSEGK